MLTMRAAPRSSHQRIAHRLAAMLEHHLDLQVVEAAGVWTGERRSRIPDVLATAAPASRSTGWWTRTSAPAPCCATPGPSGRSRWSWTTSGPQAGSRWRRTGWSRWSSTRCWRPEVSRCRRRSGS
ncbi:hypothetical protein [Nocardioides sp.]|uniref:hypothetical protein n=1 Tax=Nocardioides sp. TaxID=35761 RepID=UPI0039E408F4